jgi:hypothetical protein
MVKVLIIRAIPVKLEEKIMSENTFFTIKNCPLCGKSHKYELEIKTGVFSFGRGNSGHATEQEITRLMLCPVKDELFEAVLVLTKETQTEILSTTVVRLVEEDDGG